MNITELLSNPSMIHAAIVHMPIAAAFIGFIFVVLSAIFHRNNTVRSLTALLFLIVAVSAYVAIESGENARELVPNNLSNDVWGPLDAHAESAERVLYAGIFTLACLVISLIRFDWIRISALLLAAVGAIATNIFCANTGHLGGVLVYNHGVGTPLMHEQAATPPAETVPATTETVPEASTAEPSTLPAFVQPMGAEPELIPISDFTPEEAAQVSFKRDVWPIIEEHCTDCHENPDAEGEYDMTTVENMLKAGKKGGPGIIPGKPDESSVIQYIRGIVKPQMPKKAAPLSPETVHTLRMWIAAGALDDTAEPMPIPVPVPVVEEAPVPDAASVEAESTPAGQSIVPVEVPADSPSAVESAVPAESAPVTEPIAETAPDTVETVPAAEAPTVQ